MRIALIFLSIVLISFIFTHLLHILFKRKKYIKYIPSVIMIILGVYNLLRIRRGSGDGFADLAAAVMSVFVFVSAASSIIYAAFLDIVLPIFRNKK